MSSRIKPIIDPEDKNGKPIALPQKMKMRDIELFEVKTSGKPENMKSLKSTVPDNKIKGLPRIGVEGNEIDCLKLSEKVLDAIESIENHNGFTVGKGSNKIYCGPVIQRIPKGSYTRIGKGQSIYSNKPPVKKGEQKMTFKFDKTRQLAIKVGNNVGQDWMVVVTGNGCIFLDTSSYASFHMPVFVMGQTGDYYKVEKGNRILLLGTGHHLMFYTKEVPILYVRKHTITHQKSIPIQSTSLQSSSLKSDSLTSNEPLDQMKKENEQLIQKVESKEDKKEEPEKKESKEEPNITIEENKPKESTTTIGTVVISPPKEEEIKEIKGLEVTGTIQPSAAQMEIPRETTNWKMYGFIGLILLSLLLLVYVLYRYLSVRR